MKKNIFLLILLMTAILLFGCKADDGGADKTAPENDPLDTGDEFVLKATVKSSGEVGRIEVEVIESDYAFGIYWVLTNSDTEICDSDGERISSSDIKAGDTVKITYGGQVMMSYPPQIVASKIQRIN